MRKIIIWGSALVISSVLISGCIITDSIPLQQDKTRKVYLLPGDGHHEGHLPTDMRFMMQSLTTLMSLETDSTISESERLSRVRRELDNLENTARVIKDGDEITSYSNSSPYLGSFIHDIGMAREFTELSPPDYQPAVGLIQSCQHCHQNR